MQTHNTIARRLLAGLSAFILAALLLFSAAGTAIPAVAQSTLDMGAPTLLYNGAPLQDGAVLPADAALTARYSFTADAELLWGQTHTLSLPAPLTGLAGQGFSLYAEGAEQPIGSGSVDGDGGLTLAFNARETAAPPADTSSEAAPEASSEAPSAAQSAPPEESPSLPAEPGSEVSSESGSVAGSEPDSAVESTPPEETSSPPADPGSEAASVEQLSTRLPVAIQALQVTFDAPCAIDAARLGNEDTISLPSGGSVTVTLADDDLAALANVAFQDAVNVSSVKLQTAAGDSGVDIAANAELTFDDGTATPTALQIRVDFSLDKTDFTLPGDLANSYTLAIPTGLKVVGGDGSSPLKADFDFGDGDIRTGVPFGTLYYKSSTQEVYVEFSGTFWTDNDYESITNAWLYFGCELDGGNANIQRDKTFTINYAPLGAGSLDIVVFNNKAKPHTLAKTGAAVPGKPYLFDWTVTLTVGSVEAENEIPIFFEDFIDPAKQVYVDGSFDIARNSSSVRILGNFNYDPASGKLSYNMTDNVGTFLKDDVITITYQTTVADALLNPGATGYGSDTTIGNKAELWESVYDAEPVLTATAPNLTFKAEDKKWLTKSGVPVGRGIDWTITVNTRDRRLADLTIYDLLSTQVAGGMDYLELDLTSIKIGVNGGTPVTQFNSGGTGVAGANQYANYYNTGYSSIPGYTLDDEKSGGKTATFALQLLKVGGAYAETYTITYTTTVKDSAYHDGHQLEEIKYDNNAWMHYKWFDYGDGTTPYPFTPPTIGTSATAHISVLAKTAGTYNPKDPTILWTVTVNPHNAPVTGGTITDILPKRGTIPGVGEVDIEWEYVKIDGVNWINVTSVNSALLNNVDVTDDDGRPNTKMTMTVGDLASNSNASITYQFKTRVTCKDHTGYNTSAVRYPNTAKFVGNIAGVTGDVIYSSSAYANVASTVLEKTQGAYDYNLNRLRWDITVNKNQMTMGEVVLTDTLPAGLTLVDDTIGATSYAPSYSTSADNYASWTTLPTYSKTNPGKPTFTLDAGVVDRNTIRLRVWTQVDVDAIDDFYTQSPVEVTNSIAITSRGEGYAAGPSGVEAIGEIKTGGINSKKGSYSAVGTADQDPFTIRYSVEINKNGLALPASTIQDTLDPNVTLNADTVALYYAKLDATGAYSVDTTKGDNGKAAGAADLNLCVEWDQTPQTFTLTIPAGSERYLLYYNVDLIDIINRQYANDIQFLDSDFTTAVGEKAVNVAAGSGGGGGGLGLANRKGSVLLTKTDFVRGTPVAGAVFELYQVDGAKETCIQTATTDPSGQLEFYPLNLNSTTYFIREKTPATGYQADSAKIDLLGNGVLTKLEDYQFTVDTSKAAGGMQFSVTNAPNTANVQVTKVNDVGRTLAGVEFTLSDNDANPATRVADMVELSGANGLVSFQNVPVGSYTLKESCASISCHTVCADEFTVRVAADGSYTVRNADGSLLKDSKVVNLVHRTHLSITCYIEGTRRPLVGATFIARLADGTELCRGVTDENGCVTFPDMPYMEVLTIEHHAAAGDDSTGPATRTVAMPGAPGGPDPDTFDAVLGISEDWPKVEGDSDSSSDSISNSDSVSNSDSISDNSQSGSGSSQSGSDSSSRSGAPGSSSGNTDSASTPGGTAAGNAGTTGTTGTPGSPQTGDPASAAPVLALLMALAGTAATALARHRTKKNRK